MNLSEAHILVTGGGRGIGRHLVDRLVVEASRVAVFEKDEARIAELTEMHPALQCYSCDVTDPEAVANSIAAMESDGFNLDALVNNAGLVHSALLVNLLEKENRVHSAEEWQRVLAANLSSVFLCHRAGGRPYVEAPEERCRHQHELDLGAWKCRPIRLFRGQGRGQRAHPHVGQGAGRFWNSLCFDRARFH